MWGKKVIRPVVSDLFMTLDILNAQVKQLESEKNYYRHLVSELESKKLDDYSAKRIKDLEEQLAVFRFNHTER